jgi:tetratricopeptide (TPR) repeat protein
MNGLGIVFTAKKEYDRAQSCLEEALRIGRDKLGENNPTTLTSLQCLGALEYHRGNDEKSEKYLLEALSGRQRILGDDHPAALETKNSLAILYKSMGRYSEAKPLFEETLSGRTSKLGPQHPDTLQTQEEKNELESMMKNSSPEVGTDSNTPLLPKI